MASNRLTQSLFPVDAVAKRPAVVSSPAGFSVYADDQDWRSHIKTFPFGRRREAFALADKLEAEK